MGFPLAVPAKYFFGSFPSCSGFLTGLHLRTIPTCSDAPTGALKKTDSATWEGAVGPPQRPVDPVVLCILPDSRPLTSRPRLRIPSRNSSTGVPSSPLTFSSCVLFSRLSREGETRTQQRGPEAFRRGGNDLRRSPSCRARTIGNAAHRSPCRLRAGRIVLARMCRGSRSGGRAIDAAGWCPGIGDAPPES